MRITLADGGQLDLHTDKVARTDDIPASWDAASKVLGKHLLVTRTPQATAKWCRERYYFWNGEPRAQRMLQTDDRWYSIHWRGKKGTLHNKAMIYFFESLKPKSD